MFEKYEDFAKVMDKCTENHSCIVMDNTTGSCNVEEFIFWYKAQIDLPEFESASRSIGTCPIDTRRPRPIVGARSKRSWKISSIAHRTTIRRSEYRWCGARTRRTSA